MNWIRLDREHHEDVANSVLPGFNSSGVISAEHDETALQTLLQCMRRLAGDQLIDWWFAQPHSLQVSDREIIAFADSEFELRRLQRDCAHCLHEAVQQLFSPTRSIAFRVRDPHGRVISAHQSCANPPVGGPASINHASPGTIPADSSASGIETNGQIGHDRADVNYSRHLADKNKSEERLRPLFLERIGTTETEQSNSAQPVSRPVPSKSKPGQPRPPADLRSFQFGPSNDLARVAVQQVLDEVGQFSPLMFFGPPGSGKTHLLEGMVHHYRRHNSRGGCVYMTAEQFTSSFVQALRGSGLPVFRRKYRDLNFLAIDDIHFFAGKKATINEVQYTIDHLLRAGKQIVFAADRPPIEFTDFGTELVARLTCGLVCPLQYPDKSARVEIVKRLCEQRGVAITPDAVELIAEQITRDVRRLHGAVNRLRATLLVEPNQPTINLEMCQRALSDMLVVNSTSTNLSRIDDVVCELCGIASKELKSENRGKRISSARMLAMWLSRKYTGSALSEIGQYFGGRSHSTVIAAEKRVQHWINDQGFIEIANSKYPVREILQRAENKLRVV